MKSTVIPAKLYSAFLAAAFLAWFCAVFFLAGATDTSRTASIQVPSVDRIRRTYLIQDGLTVWLKEGRNGLKNAVLREIKLLGKTLYSEPVYESAPVLKSVEGVALKGLGKKNNVITVKPVTYVLSSMRLEATAYDASPDDNGLDYSGITALGWRTRYGIAAVDPKVIPLRSLLYIEGYGFAWAGDTGGDIKGRRIDLCYNTTEEALKWGRKKTYVYVLGTKPLSYYAKLKKTHLKKPK